MIHWKVPKTLFENYWLELIQMTDSQNKLALVTHLIVYFVLIKIYVKDEISQNKCLNELDVNNQHAKELTKI